MKLFEVTSTSVVVTVPIPRIVRRWRDNRRPPFGEPVEAPVAFGYDCPDEAGDWQARDWQAQAAAYTAALPENTWPFHWEACDEVLEDAEGRGKLCTNPQCSIHGLVRYQPADTALDLARRLESSTYDRLWGEAE